MRLFYSLFVLCALLLQPLAVAQDTMPYRNTSLSTEERVQDLLNRMTLEEKIGQMTQLNITLINNTGEQRDVALNKEKARNYILNHHTGSFLNGESVPAEQWITFIQDLQRIAVEESRLGIPLIYGIDHIHGASYLAGATIFPHNLNIAATFNPEFAYAAGEITAAESGQLGHRWNFAPVLDLGINPYWARYYETFGESPYVVSQMGAAYTRGLQETETTSGHKVAATAKHFLGYSNPDSGWDRTPSDISDQTLYEKHAPAFQTSFDAGIKTVMINSGEINGVPVHASPKYLKEILRDKMGFEGVAVTDWDDIGKLVNYHYVAKDFKDATRLAVEAGIDMSMTPLHLQFNDALLALVKEGTISEERIDESVRRILTLKFDLNLFEQPYPSAASADKIGSDTHRTKALNAARESLVLLKNDADILPLNNMDNKRILLTGPSADSRRNLNGGWTIAWQGGEEERFPEEVHTIHSALAKTFPDSEIEMYTGYNADTLKSMAAEADVIIATMGEEPYTEFVGNITDLRLPEEQIQMVTDAASSGKPVIGIFIGGRPRIVSEALPHLNAFIWAGLPGFEGAEAISGLLAGAFNPAGRLPFSYPKFSGHFVPHNHKPSDVYFFNPEEANDISQGERSVWQWKFGEGLSYTSFKTGEIQLSDSLLHVNGTINAEVEISNTGDRAGYETVIWYLRDEIGSVTRPVKSVKHFERVWLDAGESKKLSFTITPGKHLSYPDHTGQAVLEEGYFSLMAGPSKARFYFSKETIAGN